jgi:peptide/nickel transport system substrate-binding protein
MRAPALRPTLATLALATALAACRRDAASTGDVGGTLVIATPADAFSLVPTLFRQTVDKQLADLMFDHLAEIGDSLQTIGDRGFHPRLADSWTWASDSLSIAFHVDPRARWHDGQPVRAEDVRFSFELMTDPKVEANVASLLTEIDSVQVRDSLTAVYWFKRRYPEQFFDAVYQMHIVPAHLLANVPHDKLASSEFAKHPIGTGRFRFGQWEPRARIEVVADTSNWRGRPKLDRVVFAITPDMNAMFARQFAGEADVAEPLLNPALLAELPKHPDIALHNAPGADYGVLQFNLRDASDVTKPHPVFGDVGVRRALAEAVDRAKLVRAVYDTLALPAAGPMTRGQLMADTTVALPAYDPARARALLDSLGWRDDKGTGVREKNGRQLRFSVLVPGTSRPRQMFAVLLQDAFKQVGARMDIEQSDFGALMDRITRGNFDAVINAIHTDPSARSLVQTWGVAGDRRQGGQNFGLYMNSMVDQAVDSAMRQSDPEKARAYYRRAYAIIADDVPGIFLYEPRWNGLVNKRVRVAATRADAWWANLDEWSIPAAGRLPRDGVPLQTVAQR